MDWITGIQRALDYTEEHLTGEVDYEAAARAACSSPFHFQRMFTMLCGFTLGDYIRMRRLALAAEELMQTHDKGHRHCVQVRLRHPRELFPCLYPVSRRHAHPGAPRRNSQILLPALRKTDFIGRQYYELQD